MGSTTLSRRVVIVDDSRYMRRQLRRVLEEQGWAVVGEAENGREAIALYDTLQPDLVLMDITMPEMNGLVALQRICDRFPRACVVMCSAMGQQDMIVEAARSGARGFIVKPFQPERVLLTLEEVLGRPV